VSVDWQKNAVMRRIQRKVFDTELINYDYCYYKIYLLDFIYVQGGSNITGTDLYVNKPHCAAAVRP